MEFPWLQWEEHVAHCWQTLKLPQWSHKHNLCSHFIGQSKSSVHVQLQKNWESEILLWSCKTEINNIYLENNFNSSSRSGDGLLGWNLVQPRQIMWLSPCNLACVPQLSHLQNVITVTTVHINTQYILITITLWFLLPYICLRAIITFSLKFSFLALSLLASSSLSYMSCSPFPGYTIFCKYSSENTVSRTEHSAPDKIWPWQGALG